MSIWLPPIETLKEFPFKDVARNLSRINRYGGGSLWNVAAHSCLVADLVPEAFELFGLIHDAHEAWIGDLCKPAKDMIREQYEAMELVWQSKVNVLLGIDWPEGAYEAVAKADHEAVEIECKRPVFLMPHWDEVWRIRTESALNLWKARNP